MPIQTTCPSCGRALRVPDDLIGKNVKCPGCQTTFLAADEDAPASPRPPGPEDAYRATQAPPPRPSQETYREEDRKSTRLNSSHIQKSRMPSSA